MLFLVDGEFLSELKTKLGVNLGSGTNATEKKDMDFVDKGTETLTFLLFKIIFQR